MITLATLPQTTKQEVFDQVAKHLLTQKTKAEGKTKSKAPTCRYRSGKLRCAAGCLIADDEYKRSFEGYSWDCLIEKGKVPIKHSELIVDLQIIHDSRDPYYWYDELYSLAREYRLNRRALKEFK